MRRRSPVAVLPISLVVLFSLILGSLPISVHAGSVATPPLNAAVKQAQTVDQDGAATQTTGEKFVFSKVDEELLSEIKLLDERFENQGAVYHDPGLDTYLTRVGTAVAADKKLENVEWKFRALRDPV